MSIFVFKIKLKLKPSFQMQPTTPALFSTTSTKTLQTKTFGNQSFKIQCLQQQSIPINSELPSFEKNKRNNISQLESNFCNKFQFQTTYIS